AAHGPSPRGCRCRAWSLLRGNPALRLSLSDAPLLACGAKAVYCMEELAARLRELGIDPNDARSRPASRWAPACAGHQERVPRTVNWLLASRWGGLDTAGMQPLYRIELLGTLRVRLDGGLRTHFRT